MNKAKTRSYNEEAQQRMIKNKNQKRPVTGSDEPVTGRLLLLRTSIRIQTDLNPDYAWKNSVTRTSGYT